MQSNLKLFSLKILNPLKLALLSVLNFLSKLLAGVYELAIKLWGRLRSYSFRDKRFIIGSFLVLVCLITFPITLRFLKSYEAISVSDTHPFESAVEYDAFIEANPLYSANVPEGKKFTKSSQIREDKAALYVFELSTLPIKPQMSKAYAERYISYLESSQAEALDWIRSQGIDPEKVSIVWRPNPKEMRGKMLGETTKPKIDKTIPSSTPTPSPTPTPTPTGQSAPTPEGRFPL